MHQTIILFVGAFVISTGLQAEGYNGGYGGCGGYAGYGGCGGYDPGKSAGGIGAGFGVNLGGKAGLSADLGANIGGGKGVGLNAHLGIGGGAGGKGGLPKLSSLPALEVTTPDLGVTTPDLGVTTPDLAGLTVPGLGITIPNMESTPLDLLTTLSPGESTTPAEESVETDTPAPAPSTPTPETITLEVTPASASCNETECKIDCEEKGHLRKFASCNPNEKTGSCRCRGVACLPEPCFQMCLDQDYQKGYCKIFPDTGRHCYCFGCRATECFNSCRKGGQDRGYCKNFGADSNGIKDLKCICYGKKSSEPYPPITEAPKVSGSTPDVIGNEPVPS